MAAHCLREWHAAGSGSWALPKRLVIMKPLPVLGGPPDIAAGQDLRLSLQVAGVAVGSPITLGPGGTFIGTFPAPANGGTYVVRTDYTPKGATAAVASFAANLVVNGGSGGTTPLTLTIGFSNGANGQPPTKSGNQSRPCSDLQCSLHLHLH